MEEDQESDPRLQKPKVSDKDKGSDGSLDIIKTGPVANLVAKHMRMVRTFEQKNLTEEGKFINTEGIYILFEGFCGVYKKKECDPMKKQKTKTNQNEEFKGGAGESDDEFENNNTAKELLGLHMLNDIKVGKAFGMESHVYDECPAIFTIKSDEKTKLLMIDTEGFHKYVKDCMV